MLLKRIALAKSSLVAQVSVSRMTMASTSPRANKVYRLFVNLQPISPHDVR